MIPFIYKSTDNMMIQMLKQQGAGYSTSSGEVQLFNDTTGEILTTIAEHADSGAFTTFKIWQATPQTSSTPGSAFSPSTPLPARPGWAPTPLSSTLAEEKLMPFETGSAAGSPV